MCLKICPLYNLPPHHFPHKNIAPRFKLEYVANIKAGREIKLQILYLRKIQPVYSYLPFDLPIRQFPIASFTEILQRKITATYV
jgi:hypothetical protein